jgi:plastocyanin
MVIIANLAFDPAAITVPTGTTVAWTNDDAVPHTVTSTDGAFDSGIFDPGGSFSFTFNEPGSFGYICQLHPQMQGTVTAEGEPVAGGTQAAQPAENSAIASPASVESPAPAAAAGASVAIVDFAFEPAILDVPGGATVTWTNDGQAPHTVTGDFADSGILEPGQTFSHTFTESGENSYVCAIHPDMAGTVRVSAGTAIASTPTAPLAAVGTGPEGVWLIHLDPDSDATLGAHRALVTFHDDGTIDADFAAEPGDGDATTMLTSGRGEWLLEDAVCQISLLVLMNDANQRCAGTATINAQARLDADAGVLDGTFDFSAVAASSEPLGDGSGTLHGGMIPLDP